MLLAKRMLHFLILFFCKLFFFEFGNLLKTETVAVNFNSWPNRLTFRWENYLREETIQGEKLHEEIWNVFS